MTTSKSLSGRLSPESISAAFDGEVGATDFERLCQQWSEDDVREDWHTWSLIGDVLRSDDLAHSPSHDAHFLAGLRQRLTQEPAILAPAALQAPALSAPVAHRRAVAWQWWGSAAVAAGVAVAVGAWVRPTGVLTLSPSPALAQVAPPADVPVQVPPTMVRDPELDRYLAAHRQYVQGPALAAPGGVRQVAVHPGR